VSADLSRSDGGIFDHGERNTNVFYTEITTASPGGLILTMGSQPICGTNFSSCTHEPQTTTIIAQIVFTLQFQNVFHITSQLGVSVGFFFKSSPERAPTSKAPLSRHTIDSKLSHNLVHRWSFARSRT
jgi:hypothetical protein